MCLVKFSGGSAPPAPPLPTPMTCVCMVSSVCLQHWPLSSFLHYGPFSLCTPQTRIHNHCLHQTLPRPSYLFWQDWGTYTASMLITLWKVLLPQLHLHFSGGNIQLGTLYSACPLLVWLSWAYHTLNYLEKVGDYYQWNEDIDVVKKKHHGISGKPQGNSEWSHLSSSNYIMDGKWTILISTMNPMYAETIAGVHCAYFSPPMHPRAYWLVWRTTSCRKLLVKNSENMANREVGRDALSTRVSVKFCSVLGCKSEDHLSSSRLCKCNQGSKKSRVLYLVGPSIPSLLSVLS